MQGLNIVGVQFRRAGRLYDFQAGDIDLRIGDYVVVETERGQSLASVATVRFVDKAKLKDREVRSVLRKASAKELGHKGKLTPEYVESFTKEKVSSLKLKMRVLKADVQFGGNKLVVYFSAPGRVDFRELVKELASGLRTRVELKQVGARDESKLLGGLGICGREYCCSSWLREFVPVSIKMAKNQNLALNPSKVSGGCGRLLCCLTYENKLYSEVRQKMPPKGAKVRMSDGTHGDVLKADLLNQRVLLETMDGQQLTANLNQIEIVSRDGVEDESLDSWSDDIDLKSLMDED